MPVETVNRQAIASEVEEFKRIYCRKVLRQRTRIVELLGRKCSPRIMQTFLGFELKLGRRRLTCPDISSARYLKIFAQLGLAEARIPYDPTSTAALLPDLERSLMRIHRHFEQLGYSERASKPALRRLYAKIRRALQEC